ncbi:MAG: ABC transporter permease, partial [Spirochaetales bacterium]|nr:ABC transporter permease [Spirochaetales bacterium]
MMTKSKTRKIRWSFVIFFIPVALWLFLLIVLPHFELFRVSLTSTSTDGFTLDNYKAFFLEPIYWLTFARTAMYSIIVTAIVLVISLPVAFYITKVTRLKFQGLLMVLILVPFWVSEMIRV